MNKNFANLPFLAFAGLLCAARVSAQEKVFHDGDSVVAMPYGSEWWKCKVLGERVGNPPANFSYNVLCDPWPRTRGVKPPQQTHLYSAERIKAMDDPEAVAGLANMERMFPTGARKPPANPARPPAGGTPQPQNGQPQNGQPQNGQPPILNQPPAAGGYKVGDRVAMPAGYSGKYYDAVIVAIEHNYDPQSFKVHPLGYLNTMDTHFSAAQLKPLGSVQTEPIGHIADDPQLLAVQGKKAFHPVRVLAGQYACVTLTGGQLVSAALLDFKVIDASHYSDRAGTTGTYQFNSASGAVVFQSGSLKGRTALYTQASDPPTKFQPPQFVLSGSGDNCSLVM